MRGTIIVAALGSAGLFLPALDARGAVYRTDDRTDAIQFPASHLTTTYSATLNQSTYNSMVVDAAGNAHVVGTGDANHLGNVQYRRWKPSSNVAGSATTGTWDPVRTIVGGGTSAYARHDAMGLFTAMDQAADRLHIVYDWVVGTQNAGTLPGTMYHVVVDNASTATPTWHDPVALNLPSGAHTYPDSTTNFGAPTVTLPGSMVAVGSDTLVLARVHNTAGTKTDIRLDRGVRNAGTGEWTWNEIGQVRDGDYAGGAGGVVAPKLTYANGKLFMSFADERKNGFRAFDLAVSGSPTNPTADTWTAQAAYGSPALVGPDSTTYETKGGTGILPNGDGVALVWAHSNRDAAGNGTNLTRLYDGDTGTWGAWSNAFGSDYRFMPAKAAPSAYPETAFAYDGAGGLFAYYENGLISHWDPGTGTWADVFSNARVGSQNSVSLATDINTALGEASRVYTFAGGTLYVGEYTLVPEPAAGGLLAVLVGGAVLRRRRS